MAEYLIVSSASQFLKLEYTEAGGYTVVISSNIADLGASYGPYQGWAVSDDLQKIVFASDFGISVSTDYGESFTSISYESFTPYSRAYGFSRMGYANGTMYLYLELGVGAFLYTSTDCYTWTLQGASTAFGQNSLGEVIDLLNTQYYNGLFYAACYSGGRVIRVSSDFLTGTTLSLPAGVSLTFSDLDTTYFFLDEVTGKVLAYTGNSGHFLVHAAPSDTGLLFSSSTDGGLGLGLGAIDPSNFSPIGFVAGKFYGIVRDTFNAVSYIVVSSDMGSTFQFLSNQPTPLDPNNTIYSLRLTSSTAIFFGTPDSNAANATDFLSYKPFTDTYETVVQDDATQSHELTTLLNFGNPNVVAMSLPAPGCLIWNEQSMVNVRILG